MTIRPRVWAEVDLEAISNNLGIIRGRVGPQAGIMLVIKADAYGHGAIPIARHVLSRGEVQSFGVGDSEEALELRAAGIDAPILILGSIVDGELEEVVRHDIAVCIHSLTRVRQLEREARRQGRRCRVHVMVDTGMGRLGPFAEYALELAKVAADSDWLDLEGVATHYSSTLEPHDPFTELQMKRFADFRSHLIDDASQSAVFHAANSGAVLFEEVPFTKHDLVRVGAAAYGLIPAGKPGAERLKPALSLKSQIIYLKDVPAGTPISYNRMHVTPGKTRIATLPIGYNDGLRFGLSNKWHVLVRGERAPIVGAVSMDYCMIDVGRIPNTRAGDEVTLIGTDGGASITVPDMAAALGTVTYEITCSLGKRVKRLHRPAPHRPSLAAAVERVPASSRT